MDLPLHPRLVHLPIALAIIMPLLSSGLLVAWAKGALPRRTWLIAVALQGMMVGSGLLALRSGEADEERVEAVVAEAAIEAHEEAASVFVAGAVVALILTGAAAAIPRERAAKVVAGVAVLGTFAVLGLGYQVGEAGGRLVYQQGAAAAFAVPTGGARVAPPVRPDHDDD